MFSVSLRVGRGLKKTCFNTEVHRGYHGGALRKAIITLIFSVSL